MTNLTPELEAALTRIKQLEKLDSEAATHVESQIAMFERFTSEPPYVGWKGLGLALKEELEAKDDRIKDLESQLALAKIASEPDSGMIAVDKVKFEAFKNGVVKTLTAFKVARFDTQDEWRIADTELGNLIQVLKDMEG